MKKEYPDLITDEQPYDSRQHNHLEIFSPEPKHIYKLMGSLYDNSRNHSPPPKDTFKEFEECVLYDTVISAKKVDKAKVNLNQTHRKI